MIPLSRRVYGAIAQRTTNRVVRCNRVSTRIWCAALRCAAFYTPYVILVILLVGCTPRSPVAVGPNTTTTPPAVATTLPETEPPADVSAEAAPSADETPSADRAPPEPDLPAAPPQRLLVFTTAGPVRADVYLWIDNRPFTEALEALVDYVIQLADTDGDGTATWEELADQPQLQRGQFGNLSFEDPRERRRLIDLYDTNRNGWVDREEVPRLVSRGRGNSQAFSVRQTSYAAQRSRADSPLRQLLDTDGDGVLSAEEIAQAEARLRSHDLDDDELVSLAELMPMRVSQMGLGAQSGDRRRFFGSQAMFTLDDRTPWGEVLYAMQENYHRGSRLELAGFPPENLLHTLDADADGALSQDELPPLVDTPAQFVLHIRFGQREANQPRIEMTAVSADGIAESWSDERQIRVPTGNDFLVIRLRDDVGNDIVAAQAQNLLQLYDSNQNGYLEPDELPGQAAGLDYSQADQDGNEKLFADEIEAALRQRNWIRQCQIRLQGIDGEDPLLAVVDLNRDNRISAREMKVAHQQLTALDQDGSGEVEFEEIPAALVFEFFRGDQDQNTAGQVIYETTYSSGSSQVEAPAWFSGMDYNGDGDVSRREFLGTPDQFAQLDQDADGFLTVAEAVAAAP